MSDEKRRRNQRHENRQSAQTAKREDPMTSFDPEAERGAATQDDSREEREGDQAPGGSGSAAPAERAPEGNGSVRTAPGAAGEPQETPPAEDEPPAGPAEEPQQPDLEAQLASSRQESAANYDRFIRAQAELENYKKRIAKEHAESLRYALTPLVTEMAAILDNLERAVEHARKEPEDGGALLAGIEMVLKQMQETLARFGVTRIESVGKPFDPALHEAMGVVERSDVPENQVLDEFQAGYILHDRVIRPSRVIVSKAAATGSGAEGGDAPPQSG